ncbi:BZ3500_MvSof-1268-A1-R1_Chr12-2g03913 [Microbotryum saponariae]|uniref:Uricase n=1 Tax=Microbotryum saponariae TaxID=289078 RepID=A0A2X0LL78_9BASI|nr:BZ3500_MvSof-1268-A1-R1_Chr12-2g03913 [Microbotryum saponariae]SCZ99773.1 BZ3501_MvSof-1269-A2-R1_Chr12-2g03475 [Microbotryum saponariae]
MPYLKHAKYGKDKVRTFRIVRNKDGTHDIAEYIVQALLEGSVCSRSCLPHHDIETSYTKSDNSVIVATDSIKNTTYLFAKQSPHVLQPESFALDLASHFVETYSHIHKAHVNVIQLKWSRIPVTGKAHKHSFVRNGDEKRFTNVTVDATKGKNAATATVTSGISELLVLKTTESSFENYVFDKYTTLKRKSATLRVSKPGARFFYSRRGSSSLSLPSTAVDDRIFSTSVDCSYSITIPTSALTSASIPKLGIDFERIFKSVETTTLEIFATHNSASVQATLYQMCEKILADNKQVAEVSYKLPNKHYFAVDMAYFGLKNTDPKDAEVFMPVDAPSGLIIATVTRDATSKL